MQITPKPMRTLEHYQQVRQALEQKYGLTFEEFIAQDIVAAQNYGWEVEQDAMAWETAIGGIATIERRQSEANQAEANRKDA